MTSEPSGERGHLRCRWCDRPIKRLGNWSNGPRYVHTGVNGSDAAYCSRAVKPYDDPAQVPVLLTASDTERIVDWFVEAYKDVKGSCGSEANDLIDRLQRAYRASLAAASDQATRAAPSGGDADSTPLR